MIRIVILSAHQQESEILQMVFKQNGYEYYCTKPNSFNYLQLLQYRPDVLLMEIPVSYTEQLSLLRLLRKNNRFGRTPIIGYGSGGGSRIVDDLTASGCTHYIQRPIRIKNLFELMRKSVPGKDWDGEYKKIQAQKAESKEQELQRLLETNFPASAKKEIMVKYVGKLLSFPFVIAKILEVTDDPARGADDLGRVISGDPAICATILKVSNSALFASMGSKEVKNPKDAIVRLGFNEVKNISMGLGLMELFPEKDTFGFQRTEFWIFTLARAILSEKTARQAGYPNTTLAFLSGLMADFTVLLLDSFFPDVFAEILGMMADDGISFPQAHQKVLGFAHEEFLCNLMETWRLPKELQDAIRMQVTLLSLPEMENPTPERILADCVSLSSTMARAGDIGQGCDSILDMPSESIIRELKLTTGLIKGFYDPLQAGLSVFADFFSLERKLLPAIIEEDTLRPAIYLAVGRRGFDPYQQYLARFWKLKIVRDAEGLEKALAEKPYCCAFVTPANSEMAALAQEFFPYLEGKLTPMNKIMPVIAIWPTGMPSPTPGKFPFECISQRGDVRQMMQTIATLAGE